MNFIGIIVVILWLNFVATVDSVFWVKIDKGMQLDSENEERKLRSFIPKLNPNLYECHNVIDGHGWVMADCRSVRSWNKNRARIFNSANFFTAFEAELKFAHTLHLDGKDIQTSPAILAVGFDPVNIDSPLFEPYPASYGKIYDAVLELKGSTFIDSKEETVDTMVDYLCCNDILTCFLANHHRAKELLSVVRKTLFRIIVTHEANTLAKQRAAGMFPGSVDLLSESPDRKLKRAMKLMLDKMIDPCVYKAHVPEVVDINCEVNCQFLTATYESFSRATEKTAASCKSFKSGACHEGLCYCSQILAQSPQSTPRGKSPGPKSWQSPGVKEKMVKMLTCNNELRQSLANYRGPIVYESNKVEDFIELNQLTPTDSDAERSYSPTKSPIQRLFTPHVTASPTFNERVKNLREKRGGPSPSPPPSSNHNGSSPSKKQGPIRNRSRPNEPASKIKCGSFQNMKRVHGMISKFNRSASKLCGDGIP